MQFTQNHLNLVLQQAVAKLQQEAIGLSEQREAQIEAEILLSEVLNKNRTWLKTWSDYELNETELASFAKFLQRRVSGEPLAYIIGFQEFWSLSLKVTEHTLIPRPETELLVEMALDKIPLKADFKVADLGTGTGAIALSIAIERAQATVFAVDFSAEALRVAQQNRQANGLTNVTLVENSWLKNWQYGELDLIVSNPPYVAAEDPHLDDLAYEPYSALVADEDGFADIITIAEQAKNVLKPNGYLMFEHGYEQAEKVNAILSELGYQNIRTVKDLSQLDRVTLAQLPAFSF